MDKIVYATPGSDIEHIVPAGYSLAVILPDSTKWEGTIGKNTPLLHAISILLGDYSPDLHTHSVKVKNLSHKPSIAIKLEIVSGVVGEVVRWTTKEEEPRILEGVLIRAENRLIPKSLHSSQGRIAELPVNLDEFLRPGRRIQLLKEILIPPEVIKKGTEEIIRHAFA